MAFDLRPKLTRHLIGVKGCVCVCVYGGGGGAGEWKRTEGAHLKEDREREQTAAACS